VVLLEGQPGPRGGGGEHARGVAWACEVGAGGSGRRWWAGSVVAEWADLDVAGCRMLFYT